ncbi:hypothetical protein NQZ79_g3312 [Umbelopsis isabellina]|nr:hypothetical protein NQZ79_g3312 [Umbelopsis isabellina]
MTKLNIIFMATLLILLSFLTIGTVAQSSDTGSSSSSSDVTSSSDQTSTSGDGVTSGSSSSDSTTGDSGSTEPSSSPTPTVTTPSTTTATTVPPTTTTDPVTTPTPTPEPTTPTPEPTTTPTEQPSPTTPTPPQTTPNSPNPQTTPVNQTPNPANSVISDPSSVILPSSLSSSSMSSVASSFVVSSSGSPVASSIAAVPSMTGSCTNGQQCASGQYCSSGNMTCMTALADGSACTNDTMCSSGHCSNEVCIAAASSSKPSSGEIAGIVIGSIGGVGVAVGVLLCLRRRRRRRQISRMRGFTPSMALNGHLNDKNFYTDTQNATAAERHKSDYSFTSEQAALESLSSMSMTMSPIGRQSAVYYRNNQMYNLSGTSSPFDDNDTYQTMSATSSQPALLSAVPPAMQSSGVRSSKFDFLQSAFAKRKLPEKHPIQVSEHENIWPGPAHSEVSSTRTSLIDGQSPSWQALGSQPPSRQGYASSDHIATTSNRMSSTTFGSGHHHVGVDDDESVIDSAYSPAQTHPQPVKISPVPHNHNPFRPNRQAGLLRDAWSKEDEDGMNAYQYF